MIEARSKAGVSRSIASATIQFEGILKVGVILHYPLDLVSEFGRYIAARIRRLGGADVILIPEIAYSIERITAEIRLHVRADIASTCRLSTPSPNIMTPNPPAP